MSKRRRGHVLYRKVVFVIADGRCQRCGAALTGPWVVEVIDPAGPFAYSNRRAVCVTCHEARS